MLTVFLGGVFFAQPVIAKKSDSPKNPPGNQNVRGVNTENTPTPSPQGKADRCAHVNDRLYAAVETYTEARTTSVTQQEAVLAQIDRFVTRLENDGYDVSQIQENRAELERLRTQADIDFQEIINTLLAATRHNCGNANGIFRRTLEEARLAVLDFNTQQAEIETFLRSTLLTSLQSTPKMDQSE